VSGLVIFLGSRKKSKPRPAFSIARPRDSKVPDPRPESIYKDLDVPQKKL